MIAYKSYFDASDYNCLYESTNVSPFQYETYRDENDDVYSEYKFYDQEVCNYTHFSQKDFEDIPALHRMR